MLARDLFGQVCLGESRQTVPQMRMLMKTFEVTGLLPRRRSDLTQHVFHRPRRQGDSRQPRRIRERAGAGRGRRPLREAERACRPRPTRSEGGQHATRARRRSGGVHMKFGQRGIAILAPGCRLVTYIIFSFHPPYPVLVVAFAVTGFGNGTMANPICPCAIADYTTKKGWKMLVIVPG